jgi:hypothetical protein
MSATKHKSSDMTIHVSREVYKDFIRMVLEKYGRIHGYILVEVEAALRTYVAAQKAAGEAAKVNGGD